MLLRLIPHIADRVHGDERFGINLSDIVHQCFVLLLVNNRNDFLMYYVVIRTDGLIQTCTAVQLMQDVVNNIIHPG